MTHPSFNPRPITQSFWEKVGYKEGFPRNLISPIAEALPVAIVRLPKLDFSSISKWLSARNADPGFLQKDRPIGGCLVAQRGHGFIFIDGTLPSDEERYTVAHEVAHFLYHYQRPRLDALEGIGVSIEAVLDGDRPPTPAEKLTGVLREVSIGVYRHSLDRSDNGAPNVRTAQMEIEADLIAFELLAPASHVLRSTKPGEERRNALHQHFGLPVWAANAWAAWIEAKRPRDAFLARIERNTKKIF